MSHTAPRLPLTPSEQAILEAVATSADVPARVCQRAGIILSAGEGISNTCIARDLSITRDNVLRWRGRFLAQGIRALWDTESVPPRERIPEAVERAVVFDCLYRSRINLLPWDGDPSLRWNVRNLAIRHGISQASVGRIWKKHGIQMTGINGIHLEKLKISPDPLFPLTICRIGGLLYETVGPVLSFCSSARPFSELSFSNLPGADRSRLIHSLLGEFRRLEKKRRENLNAQVFSTERRLIDRFLRFVTVIAAKHPETQNHLLLKWGAIDYPAVQEWVAKQPRTKLHLAPMSPPNGPQWAELAEHWLKVIAAWPMQASLVASIQQMTQLLATCPPDHLEQLVII